jgi:citrate-Mg2+:H+ or citrate-Ca2+:H+ symporter, CitMHS family
MITILGYLLIAVFLFLVIKKKLTAFTGLIIVSLVTGIIACLVTGTPVLKVFSWIKDGLFFTVDAKGKVSLGTINSAVMILFAILYFSIMMNVGLFDPLCTFLIRKAKGDPLKVLLVTALTASVVTLDGDGTTTILIITSAFLPLFKQMKIKLSYLAMLIILPTTLGNMLPWGGPLARAASVLGLEANVLFAKVIPLLIVSEIYVIGVAYFMGKKERKRLGYEEGKKEIVTVEQIEEMVATINDKDKELKRPKLYYFNLILTAAMLYILIKGLVSGAIIFMVGTAIVLGVNYDAKQQRERVAENGGDAISVASIILAAGAFLGILNGSGMSAAIANSLGSLIPQSLGSHTALIFSFIGAVACYALPVDAYYFGILPVVAPIAQGFGISAAGIGMASFMGQAVRYASPTVPWLFLLIDRTEMSFGDYQKEFFKYSIPMFFIFIITAAITGVLPL